MKTYENDSNEDLHLHWLIHLIHLDSSGEQKRCREELHKTTCNPLLFTSRYSVPVYWCLWSCWIMSWSTSAIPHQARQVLERRPARTRKCACRTCTPWNTLELGIWEPRVITSVSLTMRYHETLHSSYVRDKQWFKVFQVDAEENLSEKVELSWWLKLLEGTKKQHASHWSRKSPYITLSIPISTNSITVLQSFAKCYKQKSSANCRHPSVVSIFQMHYLPLVVSTLLVLRIKLWKLTEYRRIVYLEPHQQLNFCSFATKCTGAHDLHFVFTISSVIWFDACAWAWPAWCPEDADILVHRPIDELFALPETHLKIYCIQMISM